MGKFLINIHDGTVCDLAGTVIVDTEKLDEAGKALLQEWNEGGNDSTACEIGEKYGVDLDRYTDNDLTYANSIAFSVKALRDEITDRLDSGYESAEDLAQAEEMMKDREYDRTKIVGIDVLNWDKPWDVMECTNDLVTTMSEEELKQWEILGI
jgi:hypothetical protein